MIRHILTGVAMFTFAMVGMEIIPVPHIPVDLLVGRAYLLPNMLFHEIPNIVQTIVRMIPMFLLLPYVFLFAAGLLALRAMD